MSKFDMNNSKSNINLNSNIWICKEDPNLSEFKLMEKLKKEIPGDYKLDFIRLENPMMDPNNKDLLKNELTKKQMDEYITYRFFLKHNSSGWIRSQES